MGLFLITRTLKSEETFLAGVRERDERLESGPERCYLAGFEDGGRGPRGRGRVQPLEAGKGKEMNSSLECSERTQP